MHYVFCLMLIIFSAACGSEDEFWRKEIEKRLSVIEEFNINIQRENEELKALVMDTQQENRRLQIELEYLSRHVSNCEGLIHREDEDAERLPAQILESPGEASKDSGIFDRRLRNQPVSRIIPPASHSVSAVAFYGYLSQPTAHNLPSHYPIVYDIVLTNKGNGYNKGDGIFIAPVTGVYAFHFSVCVIVGPESPWASLEITRNGNVLGATYEEAASSGSGNYHCSSTLVISDVNMGDHVFIRTNQPTRGPVFSGSGGTTSFSGWLLFQ